jgi:hypothetical protein
MNDNFGSIQGIFKAAAMTLRFVRVDGVPGKKLIVRGTLHLLMEPADIPLCFRCWFEYTCRLIGIENSQP